MLTASVHYSKSQDYVILFDTPWYAVILETIASRFLNMAVVYNVCCRIIDWTEKHDRELIRLPVTHGCEAAVMLWPTKERDCLCQRNLDSDDTDTVDVATQITDAINSDPGEVSRLTSARLQARRGERRPWSAVRDEIEIDQEIGPEIRS